MLRNSCTRGRVVNATSATAVVDPTPRCGGPCVGWWLACARARWVVD